MQTVHVGDQTEHIVNCPTLLISLQLLKTVTIVGSSVNKEALFHQDFICFHLLPS